MRREGDPGLQVACQVSNKQIRNSALRLSAIECLVDILQQVQEVCRSHVQRARRVRFGTAKDKLTRSAMNHSVVMLSDTEDMATYNYCGGGMVTHTLYTVLLQGLPADSKIFYQVDTLMEGVAGPASPMLSFRTPPLEPAATLRFLATADVGDPVSHSWTALPQMARQCQEADDGPLFELGLHIGDIA